MTRIKICGVTRAIDVELALELGAEALGFNFVPGTPRALEPQVAAPLSRMAADRTLRVGVFQNAPLARVREIAKHVELDCIQLHGDESLEMVLAMDRPVIRALRADAAGFSLARALPDVDILLDHPSGGGSGRAWDYARIRELAAEGRRLWIAGGLGPDNVRAAIDAAEPYGVDASSGLEASPGIKDPLRMRRFVAAVRAGAPLREGSV